MLRAAIVGTVVIAFASAARAECPPGKPCNDPKSVPVAKPVTSAPATATVLVPAQSVPKRTDSCAATRTREADLVNRLAAAKRRIVQLEATLAAHQAQLAAENARLVEERRTLGAKLR